MIYKFNEDTIEKVFDFAKQMTTKHRPRFSGNNVVESRDEREIFENVIQGKLAEEAVYTHIKQNYPNAVINSEIDYGVYDIGVWDNDDLVVNSKRLSIKASKQNAVALLIESSRFDSQGNYNYGNNDGTKTEVDEYIFVTVDIAGFISWSDLKGDFNNFKSNHNIKEMYCDIKGFISHSNFIKTKTFIPRGTPMNAYNMKSLMVEKNNSNLRESKVTMIADNYGVHISQLKPF